MKDSTSRNQENNQFFYTSPLQNLLGPSLKLPTYCAPKWLPGAYLQTVYPAKLLQLKPIEYRREIWNTPDHDQIIVDWIDGAEHNPLVVLFHGLEGSSKSHYAVMLAHQLKRLHWRGAIVHFRSCGGVDNLLPRVYHAGDSKEVEWILRRFQSYQKFGPLLACGVSLGGNVLLKWLGEKGQEANNIVHAAAAVCAPIDLVAAGFNFDQLPQRLLYTHHFLKLLRKKMIQKTYTHHLSLDIEVLKKIRTLKAFDDMVTAPLHGFANALEYWHQASSKPYLPAIRVPTLILHAQNDPIIPFHTLPQIDEVSEYVTLLQTSQGGHVGFVEGSWPGQFNWLPKTLTTYFSHCLSLQNSYCEEGVTEDSFIYS